MEEAECLEEEAQVAAGKAQEKFSPIVQAIASAETATTAEIQVHLSKRWFEPDPLARARRIFTLYGMEKTAERNAVLLYVNLRRHKFAIVGDEGIHRLVGQHYWEAVVKKLSATLHETHPEKAIASAVHDIGLTLQKYFPLAAGGKNVDELPNSVREDE